MVALTRRHQEQLRRLRNWAAFRLGRAWDLLPGYDRKNIPAWLDATASTIDDTQASALASANGFYSLLTGARSPAIAVADIGSVGDLEGPFLAHWHALAEGRDFDEAVQAGRNAAEAEGEYVAQSTARRTGDVFTERTGERVIGWRRVLTGKSCRWCATVAGQRYNTAESADFGHRRCDCTAVPILRHADPGLVINKPIRDQVLSVAS
jgi:hypothetical protein